MKASSARNSVNTRLIRILLALHCRRLKEQKITKARNRQKSEIPIPTKLKTVRDITALATYWKKNYTKFCIDIFYNFLKQTVISQKGNVEYMHQQLNWRCTNMFINEATRKIAWFSGKFVKIRRGRAFPPPLFLFIISYMKFKTLDFY